MDDELEAGWSLTESDPLVFTQLLQDIGIKGLQVDDVYSLDPGTLETLQPVHALIFLFKWVGDTPQNQALAQGSSDGLEGEEITNPDDYLGLYFANQVINNSCGTLAALNAVMNIAPQEGQTPDESISHGDELQNLRDFGVGMNAVDLGYLITNSDRIRQVHNSFSASSPFSISQHPSLQHSDKEDPYHFVAYVPVQGCLWELDGLRRGPIRHGAVDEQGEGWLGKAREVIEKRIATYGEGSLMFNLLCVRSAAIPRLQRLIADPTTPRDFIPTYQSQLAAEREKVRRGKLENGLRRNNLVPLMVELTKILGEQKGQEQGKSVLLEATEKARVVGRERRERRGE
ncbi:hypothetical protein NliqN6_0881 [Naganishia liquefaciens]|uniref:Ubiquitin carboxyl-terminal hydrolase n=1 Tax=Naganishia liquefaciens TaxID=104408 RepID=A0A8H3TP83_9TREE|nr:hypothetical protein NliqN6_0881 [Naganishia liquefaciens]